MYAETRITSRSSLKTARRHEAARRRDAGHEQVVATTAVQTACVQDSCAALQYLQSVGSTGVEVEDAGTPQEQDSVKQHLYYSLSHKSSYTFSGVDCDSTVSEALHQLVQATKRSTPTSIPVRVRNHRRGKRL